MSERKAPTGTAEAFSKMIEHEQKQPPAQKLYEHEHAIGLQNGQRAWEGEHRVVIKGTAPTWDSEILIDGRPLSSATERIEIDVDCKQPIALVKLTRYERSPNGNLIVDQDNELRRVTELLTANLLDITLEEARVVDVILNRARQEATSNAKAVQLFSITDTDEQGEQTTQILGNVLRDAVRYRALRARIASQPEGVEMWYQSPEQLDHHADDQVQVQAEQRRIEAET